MLVDDAAKRRKKFRNLHSSGCFIIPNPWDIGTTVALTKMGFKALATTSSGFAWSQGRRDGDVTLHQCLSHLRQIVQSTDLPVSADFESGFAGSAEQVFDNVALAVKTGISGLSIEDSTAGHSKKLRSISESVERIHAARAAMDRVDPNMILVARAENFLVNISSLDDAIERLVAYSDAGADCLYAPGLTTLDEIRAVVDAVWPKAVNVLVGSAASFTVSDLSDVGVRRISVGGGLARAAWNSFLSAAYLISAEGKFHGFTDNVSSDYVNSIFTDDT